MGEKVFVLGFDGATFDLLKPWEAEKEMVSYAK